MCIPPLELPFALVDLVENLIKIIIIIKNCIIFEKRKNAPFTMRFILWSVFVYVGDYVAIYTMLCD
jgi:hypothetical protein